MTCPICLDTITDSFKTSCCKQLFCYKCYFKACVSTHSCPMCRNNHHTVEILKEFNNIKIKIQNYKTNRVHAMGYSRIQKKSINEIFIFYRNNDYLIDFKEFRENIMKEYFEVKIATGWQEWKEFDSFISDYNLDYSSYILSMIN